VLAEDTDLGHVLLLSHSWARERAPQVTVDIGTSRSCSEGWALGTDSNRHLLIHIQAFWPTELPQGTKPCAEIRALD
jgi:hypothetical protein